MREQIETAFPQCIENTCIEEHTDSNIFIIDPEEDGPCQVVATEEEAHLVIKNPQEINIHLLKIDQCLFFDDSVHKKCDCAVFTETLFCFVEIKNTVRSKQRSNHRRKARKQLEQTIQLFQDNLDFSAIQQQAIICFTFKPARPVASTSAQEAAVLFQDQYNVTLLEGNEVTFP